MKKRHLVDFSKKYVYSLALIVIMVSTGCTRAHSRNPSILLDDISCMPPCWENIVPGVTNLEETLTNLEKIQGISKGPFLKDDIEFVRDKQHIGLYFPKDVDESFVSINFHDDVVTKIRFSPESITLGELVDLIGTPEEIFIVKNRHESFWIWVDLLYPSKGIIIEYINFRYSGDDTGFFDLKNNIKPTDVYYFDPMLYDEMIDDVVLASDFIRYPDEELQKGFKDWNGFGLIEYKDLTKIRE